MPKSLKVKVGNKAKSRQHTKNRLSGKYERQRRRTEINRKRRHKNHIRLHPNDLPALKLLVKQ